MKRILLDTHVLIWWMNGDEQLGHNAQKHISNTENAIYISAASVWEMSIKQQLGKLTVPDDIESLIEELGFSALPINLFHSQHHAQGTTTLTLITSSQTKRAMHIQAQPTFRSGTTTCQRFWNRTRL